MVPTAFIGTDVTDDFGSCSRLEVVSTMFGVGVYNGIGVGSLLLAVMAPFNAGTPSSIENVVEVGIDNVGSGMGVISGFAPFDVDPAVGKQILSVNLKVFQIDSAIFPFY